jgi:hypothetical protein
VAAAGYLGFGGGVASLVRSAQVTHWVIGESAPSRNWYGCWQGGAVSRTVTDSPAGLASSGKHHHDVRPY